jgi:hypothetical protein
MTEQEILEGNKLIADFMGEKWEINSVTNYQLPVVKKFGKWKGLRYHTSWDWLMPVVVKIENINYASVLIQANHTIITAMGLDAIHIDGDIIKQDRITCLKPLNPNPMPQKYTPQDNKLVPWPIVKEPEFIEDTTIPAICTMQRIKNGTTTTGYPFHGLLSWMKKILKKVKCMNWGLILGLKSR